MNEIQKPSDNLGGLLQIWVIPTNKIWFTGKNVSVNPDDFYKFYFAPESMEFSEPQKVSGSGTHYLTELSGFVPKPTEELLAMIKETSGKKFIVIFQDGNGFFRAAGTALYPLKLSAQLDQGKSVTDLAGYKITLSGQSILPAIYINSPF